MVLAEYLAISLTFDAQPLRAQIPWLGWTGEAGTLGLVALTAIVALWRAPAETQVAPLLARLRPLPQLRWRALVHGAAVVVFFLMSRVVLDAGIGASPHRRLLLGGWVALVVAVVASALAMAIPGRAIPAAARLAARPVGVGLLAGVLVWLSGRLSETLWPYLARATLESAGLVLQPFARGELFKDASTLQLGLGAFVVEVSAVCSGVQGMGLIAALSIAYLLRFRDGLRFPIAWVIVPIGVAGAYAANVLRIAALVGVGRWLSPDVAMGGFHSKAGWLLTCALALGLLAWVRRSPTFSRDLGAQGRKAEVENPTVPYLLPLLVSFALALATGAAVSSFDLLTPLRVFGVGVALALMLPGRGIVGALKPSALSVAIGVATFPFWLMAAQVGADDAPAFRAGLSSLSGVGRAGWLVARVLGAVVIAPLVEELAFRGFLLRRLVAADFDAVDYRTAARSPWALLASAAAFGALHRSPLAGTTAGAAYGLALLTRGRLSDAIVAHAVTNALLVAYALVTARYELLG